MKDSKRGHILLAEDNDANILVAKFYLDEFGFDYDIAKNGIQAVEKAQKGSYQAILMDVQMAEMDGIEATRVIRRYEAEKGLKPVPIIGMTAHAFASDKQRCLDCGMTDYISKPFDPKVFESKLDFWKLGAAA